MARAPLLQLSGVSLTFGGNPLFDSLDLTVQSGDRLALVGRNGSGKSTLMKLMAGQVAADAGSRAVPPGTTVGYMEQDPDFSGYATLGDFAAAGLPEAERFRVAVVAEGLGFDPAVATGAASGGERRRAALARLLAAEPELMLLDEPTNHLDIQAITWLEDLLAESRAAHVVISHDRAFLRRVTRGTLWLDRGTLRRNDRGFEAFEDWRDTVWDEEDLARHKLERKIKAEARWAVEGISARRRRNMGRVRALNAMRAERAAMIRRQGTADLALDAGQTSGRLVIEASGISKAYGDRLILRPLDLTVLRGDRVAIVGPNGSGKTTLLRLLTGELAPDSGRIRQGTNLEIAVFDQSRAALDLPMSLWDGLVNDPGMAVSGRSDQVMVRGAPRHVVAYLKDFLFDDAQARAPIGSLSGGEKARLLLARIMARPSNLLILDEPTNDLDVETLDLLQDVLGEYDGTVLLVSHDRDFIDRIATTTVILDGSGRATVYAGGWSDMQAQRAGEAPAGPARGPARPATGRPPAEKASAEKPPAEKPPATKPRRATGLTFTERHRLDSLPAVIGKLEAEIAKLSELLADPDLYARAPGRFARASEGLAARQAALGAAEDEWLELAARDEG